MIDYTRLRDIREDKDITQKEISSIINVKRSTYSLWELGISIIPLKNLVDFTDYFNISLDYALGLTSSKGINKRKGIDFKALGDNLKKCRKENNLTQTELSKKIGVTQKCISFYEKGNKHITITNLYKYSLLFHKTLNELCNKNN